MDATLVPSVELRVERDGGAPLCGRLRALDGRLVLELDDPAALDPTGPVLRAVAEGLARNGMTVRVAVADEDVATLGAANPPWRGRAPVLPFLPPVPRSALRLLGRRRHLVLLRRDG